jgi:hypothetical protein
MVAKESHGCYGKLGVAMDVNGCFGKSQVAMASHLVLKKSMEYGKSMVTI